MGTTAQGDHADVIRHEPNRLIGVPVKTDGHVAPLNAAVFAAMSSHPDIDMMSFTGTTRAGIQVAQAAADTVERVAQERAGNVHINGAGLDFKAPFGGYKQSGNGREWGEFGMEEFLEVKAVMNVAAA